MRRLLPGPTVANRGLVLLVAALCACIVVAAAATGWWLRTSADDMAAAVFDAAGADARQLQVTYVEVSDDTVPDEAAAELSRALPPTAQDELAAPRHMVETPDMVPKVLPPRPAAPAFVSIAGFPDVEPLVELVAGRMPRPGSAARLLPKRVAATYNPFNDGEFEPPDGPVRARVVEVVLEESAAEELVMPVGSWVQLSSSSLVFESDASALLHVVGTFRAAAPPPTALDDADAARDPLVSVTPEFNLVRATALAADEETVLGATWEAEPDVRWTFDLASSPQADDSAALVTEMRKAGLQSWPPILQAQGFTAVTGIGGLAERVVGQRTTSDGVLALALTALGAAALTVLLAAALVLASRRRSVTTVVRARGASTRWLAGLRGGEALLLTAPGVAAALGLVAVVGAGVTRADVATALLAAAACALLVTAAQLAPRATDGGRLQVVLRDAVQLVLVGLAGAAVALALVDDDLAADDPVLLVVPPLLGAAAAIGLMRLLQAGLGGLRRAVGGTRRLAPVMSLSQASAVARQVVLASAAVVLTVSSGWLGVAVSDTLRAGAEQAGWEQVGADAAVRAGGFHDDTVARLADVSGVSEVAALATTGSVSLDTRTGVEGVELVATDVDALAKVGEERLRDLSLPDPPPGELTAVASSDLQLSDEGTTLRYAQATIPVRVVDRVDRIPGVTDGGSFLLVDLERLAGIVDQRLDSYSTVLLAGSPDRAAVESVARSVDPLATFTTREAVGDRVLEGPATARTLTMLTVSTAATAALAVFSLLLMVGLGAPVRRRTGAVLSAIGADARQVRRVQGLALAPIVVAAFAAAVACGLVLTTIVDHGFRLADLTGTVASLPVRPSAATVLVVAGALGGLAVLAVLVARGTGRRTDLQDLDQEHA